MENNTLPSWMQSSMDPTVVSNTIRGAGVSISGVLLLVLAVIGHPVDQGGYTAIVDQVALLGGQIAAGAGAAWTLYGLFMKGVMFVHRLFSGTSN